jgi:light-independent protochlorophyllide reductase subunit B
MGFEGANVIFDTWVHPLMMGLEEHLLGMFRQDFEFHAGATPSHLGGNRPADSQLTAAKPLPEASNQASWSIEAQKELGKIPFFVRGKAKRNTEKYALDQGVSTITVDTLYDAKAHFSR